MEDEEIIDDPENFEEDLPEEEEAVEEDEYQDEPETGEEPIQELVDEIESPTEVDEFDELISGWKAEMEAKSPNASSSEEFAFVKTIEKSPLIQKLIKMRQLDWSDEDIQFALGSVYSKLYGNKAEQAPEEQEPPDYNDPATLSAFVQAEIEKRLSPITKQTSEAQAKIRLKEVYDYNNGVLYKSLDKLGIDPKLEPQDIEKIKVVLQTVLPGFNVNEHQLTQGQADAVLNLALNSKRKTMKNAPNKAKEVSKNLKTPRIASGKETSTRRDAPNLSKQIDGLSKSERSQRLAKFYKPQGV